ISSTQEANLEHTPVPVPDHQNPLSLEDFWKFELALEELGNHHCIPPGFGMLPDEWEDGEYHSVEGIKVGWKQQSWLVISLSDEIWRP
ncbi:hypothetical protein P691DRAFT_684097, partial [Macrolepiota fuliginosa MF-IS2]